MKKLAIPVLMILFLGTTLIAAWNNYKLEKENTYLRNLSAQTQEVQILIPDSSLAMKYAEEVSKLTIENKTLRDDLKRTKSKAQSLTEVLAVYQDSLSEIHTTPITLDSQIVRSFDVTKDSSQIAGYFQTKDPYDLNITKLQIGIGLNVIISENKHKQFSVYAESKTSNLRIYDIQSKVIRYKKPWYKNLFVETGILYGSPVGVDLGIGYSRYGVSYGYSEHGTYIRGSYKIINGF